MQKTVENLRLTLANRYTKHADIGNKSAYIS
jgi:hypothetical protein